MTEGPRHRREWPRNKSPSQRRGGRRIQIIPPTRKHHITATIRKSISVRNCGDNYHHRESKWASPIIDKPSDERGSPQQSQACTTSAEEQQCLWVKDLRTNHKIRSIGSQMPHQSSTSISSPKSRSNSSRVTEPKNGRGQKGKNRQSIQSGHRAKEWTEAKG